MRIKAMDPNSPAAVRRTAVARYVNARQVADQANELVAKAQQELLNVLAEQELKSSSAEIAGVRYVTTATSRTTTKVDEQGLKKALGARTFNKLTKPVLDKAKLETAINEGDVDAAIVSQFVEVKDGATSIRLTKATEEDSDGDA